MAEAKNETQDVDLENNEEEVEGDDLEGETEKSDREKELESDLEKSQAELKESQDETTKFKRMAKQGKKKAEEVDDTPETKPESSDLDFGQKAFLRSYEIKGADELELVTSWMKRTGDTLDVVVEDDIFTTRLEKLREAKASKDAVPKSTKRSAQTATDDVQRWTNKIKSGDARIGDIEDRKTREKVLNAQLEQVKTDSTFTDNSVVGTAR